VRALACAWTLASCVLAASVEARSVRAFPIQHHPVSEIALLVEPLLSPDGTMTIQPQFNLLTVQDTPEAIERVARPVAEWDVKPPSYLVRVRVLLGTTVPATPGPASPPIDGFGAELTKVFHFTSYREVETVEVTATEGSTVEAEAGGRYHLKFLLRAVAGYPERVQLAQFEIARRNVGISGNDTLRPVLRTTVSLEVGQTAIVAAARSEGASQGLVLVLSASRESKP